MRRMEQGIGSEKRNPPDMFQKEWEVLVVDDEPDMLTVTRLAMKNTRIYGAPLKLHLCGSKAEALELINTKADLLPALAVAIIDVVMETDTAGLDLCRFIREERHNYLTQLFIRTGQPGLAPEREVVDRYEINGFFTKSEATEDKLYSMIKSGVRQYYWSAFAMGGLAMTSHVNAVIGSRGEIAGVLQRSLDQAFQERSGQEVASYENVQCAFVLGDEAVATYGWDAPAALAARDRLEQLEGTSLGLPGCKYVIDEDHRLLVKGTTPQGLIAYSVSTPRFRVPDFVPSIICHGLVSYAAAWQLSQAGS